MYDLFIDLVGELPFVNDDLTFVFACIFYLFLLTEFCRLFSIVIDYIFKRKNWYDYFTSY